MTQKPNKQTNFIQLLLTGFAMGSADIVPGVSGGTIAFIFGIYEQLIESIKIASGQAIKELLQGKLKTAIKTIPFNFLIPVFLGIALALFTFANLLSYLLKEQPEYLWSFFFGLVISSIFIIKRKIKAWHPNYTIAIILSTIATYLIVGLVPIETPATPLAFFLSGIIAICAMILPGISGSFLLILMGKYSQILNALVQKDLLTLIIFISGTIIGISLFSRLLSWLFKHYHDLTVSILIGVLIGSLRKIWPWKITLETYTNQHGEIFPLIQNNVLPSLSTPSTYLAVLLILFGIGFILYLTRLQSNKK